MSSYRTSQQASSFSPVCISVFNKRARWLCIYYRNNVTQVEYSTRESIPTTVSESAPPRLPRHSVLERGGSTVTPARRPHRNTAALPARAAEDHL